MRSRIFIYLVLAVILSTAFVMLMTFSNSKWFIGAASFIGLFIIFLWAEIIRDDGREDGTTNRVNQTLITQNKHIALLDKLPFPAFVIDESSRIQAPNEHVKQLIPKIAENLHFANLFRAPDFVEAVKEARYTGKNVSAVFEMQTQKLFLKAEIVPLSKSIGISERNQTLVFLTDNSLKQRQTGTQSVFIANASHELKTPLTSIIGYIETLQGHAKNDPKARDKFLNIMGKQASRMQRLVEDLMSLTEIELDEHVPLNAMCDLDDVVKDALNELAPMAEQYGVTFVNDMRQQKIEVIGDRDQLHQVFVNLLDNALKYGADEGAVIVAIASKSVMYPHMVGISIEDEGDGIDREIQHRLTERFYRANVEKSKDKSGTGLGLAIVKHILKRHKGDLQIYSKRGEGSVFTVWLPNKNLLS